MDRLSRLERRFDGPIPAPLLRWALADTHSAAPAPFAAPNHRYILDTIAAWRHDAAPFAQIRPVDRTAPSLDLAMLAPAMHGPALLAPAMFGPALLGPAPACTTHPALG